MKEKIGQLTPDYEDVSTRYKGQGFETVSPAIANPCESDVDYG